VLTSTKRHLPRREHRRALIAYAVNSLIRMDFLPVQDVYTSLFKAAAANFTARIWALARGQFASPAASLDEAVLKAATATSGMLANNAGVQRIDSALGGEKFRAFLLSTEASDIAGALVFHLALQAPRHEELRLRARFNATASWYTELPQHQIGRHADRVFDALREGAQSILAATDPHAALFGAGSLDSDRRMRFLREDAADNTNKLISLFNQGDVPDFTAVLDFERQICAAIRTRHARIEPPNYDSTQMITVDELYIPPHFSYELDGPNVLTTWELDTRVYRTIILGHPGAGKSSYARSLCYRIAANRRSDGLGGPIPLMVELREYATAKAARGASLSLLDHLEHVATAAYQTRPPPHALEYLLRSGRLLLVLDGLDELLETTDRREIRSDLEVFAERYPSASMLVTSRIIGYAEAPLNDDRFRLLYMKGFEDAQVADYAQHWFRLFATKPEDADDLATGFIEESTEVADLRRIPLLLSLMCSIYRRKKYLPRHRAGVYQECAEMLFDRWDRSRKLLVERSLDDQLLPALQHVAYWIFQAPERRFGVTGPELVDHLRDYVYREVIDDRVRAKRIAQEFFDYCRGRGWVLVPCGTQSDDQELFRFAHETFLEFFTASWLASSEMSTEKVAETLLPRIAAGEWDMVGLLVVQLRKNAPRGSGNTFIRALLDRVDSPQTGARERTNLLGFAARTTEFMVTRPEITRALSCAAIRNHLSSMTIGQSEDILRMTLWSARALVHAEPATASVVLETISQELGNAVQAEAAARAEVAAQAKGATDEAAVARADDATRRAKAAVEFAREIGDERSVAYLTSHLGSCYAGVGNMARAIKLYEHALPAARNAGDEESEASIADNLADCYVSAGEMGRAIEPYELALAFSRRVGDRRSEAKIAGNLGSCYLSVGETSRAIEPYERALAIAQDTEDRRSEAKIAGNLGSCYLSVGETSRAIEPYERALAIAQDTGDRPNEAVQVGNLGSCYACLGEARQAMKLYEEALAISRETRDRKGEAVMLVRLGEAHVDLGAWRQAVGCSEQGVQIADNIGFAQGRNEGCVVLAMAQLQLGDLDAALATVQVARADDYASNSAEVALVLGVVRSLEDKVEVAKQAFSDAVTAANAQLGRTNGVYGPLDTKALALCGLVLMEARGQRRDEASMPEAMSVREARLREASQAFSAARSITRADGIVRRVLRLFDALANGDEARMLRPMRSAAEGASI
jgi:tetratricopeptide (TPR) repeat protein